MDFILYKCSILTSPVNGELCVVIMICSQHFRNKEIWVLKSIALEKLPLPFASLIFTVSLVPIKLRPQLNVPMVIR